MSRKVPKGIGIQPMSDIELEEITQTLADTTPSIARGSTTATTYMLEPKLWFKDVVDAGKKRFRYGEVSMIKEIPKGHKNAIVPKRKHYMSGSAWAASVSPGTAVNYTSLSNFDAVEITPSWFNYGVAVTYDTIQQNLIDYVSEARKELTYHSSDVVDQAIVTAISGATKATSTALGTYSIYGGDATQASELADGDILTTDMVAEGKKKLSTSLVYYWTLGTGESIAAKTAAVGNPWENENDFVLLIAPEQEEAFLTDSQFINAAEYGSDKVIQNGEIGSYLGVKIIVSNNTKQVASGASGTTDGTLAGTDMNTAVMTKAKKGTCLAHLKRPTLHVVDFPRELEVDLILEQAYGTGVIQEDSLVHINVSQV